MGVIYLLFLSALVLALTAVSDGQPGPGASCLCLEELEPVMGWYQPTVFAHANDGSNRLFVGEQRGILWTYLPDGSISETPFLNLTNTDLIVDHFTGFFGFAFHPDFTTNGLVYVHYTITKDDAIYERISEMSLSTDDPDVIDPDTERVLLELYWRNVLDGHYGGAIFFGDDNYLYFSFGDGFCCMDPWNNGQNKSTYHAAVHRIDVDSRTGNLPYGIPPDNPFIDDPEAVPELFAYGLRQPYTVIMDRGDRDTGEGRGRIFLGDVGDETMEEIDIVVPGGNYGWSVWEGTFCHEPTECNNPDFIEPIVTYNRSMGITIVLGGVYRGCQMPDLNEWLIFGDYGSRKLFGAVESSPNTWNAAEIPMCSTCPGNLVNTCRTWMFMMGESESGEIYLSCGEADTQPWFQRSSVYRIVDPNNPGTPCV